jgi:hypothetical protein
VAISDGKIVARPQRSESDNGPSRAIERDVYDEYEEHPSWQFQRHQ